MDFVVFGAIAPASYTLHICRIVHSLPFYEESPGILLMELMGIDPTACRSDRSPFRVVDY
ncbi:MAG: hypothetical protein ABSB22_06295 [Thermodesulfobacteriota bacterium]|jgi:hypothetical protein